MNKLARAVTKWTRACDRRPARLFCHVGNTTQHCRLCLFQDSDFAGDLVGSKSTSGRILCIFGSRGFAPISWMCKKQTSVSLSSTESEICSLDAGLRMDGIPALDLWDVVIEVLHSSNNNTPPTQENSGNESRDKGAPGNCMRTSNVRLRKEGTHQRTKSKDELAPQDPNQLADLLTKGSFTRDEWCNLLRLFNIMNFLCSLAAIFRSVEKATTMSKRIRERKKEGEPAEAKPRSVCWIS